MVSLGGTRSLLLGLALATLTVCFLWLERLPLKPGLGVAGLLALALFGALPLAAAADRGQPWFDYRSFAESLGPDDPIRFSWTQSYGPITWPRDGNEVMRVVSKEPLYWKARNLDVFNRFAWTTRSEPVDAEGKEPFAADLPPDWGDRPAWTSTIEVSIRRMRIRDVIGAGTTVDVSDASRNVEPAISPGTYSAPSILRRGDSYTAKVHVPDADALSARRGDLGQLRRAVGRARDHRAVQARRGRPGPSRRGEHPRQRQARARDRGRRSTSRPGTAPARTTPPTRPRIARSSTSTR